jgi:putative membrane protein
MSSETPPAQAGTQRRLHGTSVIFGLGPIARTAIPILLILFLGGNAGWQTWALVGIVPALIQAFVRFLSFTYELSAGALVLREGILSRTVRTVPYARIQHVELTQGPLQRLLRVAEVSIQGAAGGDEPEAVLRVVSMAEADALRARIEGNPAGGEERRSEVVLHLTPRDLILAGLTEGRGWVVVGALVGVAWETAALFGFNPPFSGGEKEVRDGVELAESFLPTFGAAVLGILGMIVLFRAVSVAWAAVMLHDFTLTREGGVLRSRCGMVTRYGAAIPSERVQILTVIESPVLRLTGRVGVRVRTAAQFSEKENRVGSQWLAPVVEKARAAALVREVLPEVDLDALTWRPLPPAAARRRRISLLLAALAVGGMSLPMLGVYGLPLAVVAVVAALLAARALARSTAYAVNEHSVAVRGGWWTRRTVIVPMPRVQVVRLSESFLDRWWKMASVAVDSAGAGGGEATPSIPYLPRREADGIFARIFAAAASDEDKHFPLPAPS